MKKREWVERHFASRLTDALRSDSIEQNGIEFKSALEVYTYLGCTQWHRLKHAIEMTKES